MVFLNTNNTSAFEVVVPNKPECDKKSYRCLTLPNELRVTLISDPDTDKSAVAMDVNIGSLVDPREVMGLAHFCEHMVFMGSEKYKEENFYSKYLSQNNGEYNAYTSSEHTNFYFQIKPENLFEAMDIFAQFFISPLFTESATDRELLAVNSEHGKNICNDYRRNMQLDHHLSDPTHDYNKFATGNLQTLKEDPQKNGFDVRKALLDFHSKYYSANIMSLCVLGRESLDQLQTEVTGLFSAVPNQSVQVPRWDRSPWTEAHLKQLVLVSPVRDCYDLFVIWPIPDYSKFYHSKPDHYVSHLVGHEGEGSLLSLLKRAGWANKLTVGASYPGNGFGCLLLNLELFEAGLDMIDDVLDAIYSYLATMKESGPLPWIFEEYKQIKEMQFRFKETSRLEMFVSRVAHDMHVYESRDVLEGPYLMREFRPDLVKEIVDCLTPGNMKIFCAAKKFESQCTEEEYWYKTKYHIHRLEDERLQRWASSGLRDDLYLPKPNPYIATDFSIKASSEGSATFNTVPDLLRDSALSRWWFLKDSYYLLPKGFVFFNLSNNLSVREPLAQIMNWMIVDLFSDAINEESYDALLANLEFAMNITNNGIKIQFTGFNEKIPVFINDVISKLATFSPDPKKFESFKDNRFRQIRNFETDSPLTQADKFLSCLMSEVMWTPEELLSTINDVTLENFQAYFKLFFSKFFTEGFVYGNFKSSDALTIMNDMETTFAKHFNLKPLLKSQMAPLREVLLPENSNYIFHYVNAHQPTSAIMTYLQGLAQTTRSDVLTNLCTTIVSEPLFNQLRTKEQLGYIVGCNVRMSNSMQGHRIYLQSAKTPSELDARVESFLNDFHTALVEMSDEEFQCHVTSLKDRITEKPKDMSKQGNKVWQEIVNQHYNFDRDTKEVEELMKITKSDLLDYYRNFVDPNSKSIKKFSIYVTSSRTHGDLPPVIEHKNNVTVVEDLVEFKKNRTLSSLVQPLLPKVKEVPTAKL